MTASDPGPLPKLEWIDKSKFVIDHHYQRQTHSERSQTIIRKITRDFCWARFQPPTVTPGPKGTYFVIDGQHRVLAAQERDDIGKLPVYIVPEISQAEQARHFIAINQDRVRLHTLAIFHAELALGERKAVKIKEVCDEADITILDAPVGGADVGPRETMAVGAIGIGIDKYGEENVIAALMIVADTFKLAHGQMRSTTLKVLMHFFMDLGVKNVKREALKQILKKMPPSDLEYRSAKYARKKGGSTRSVALSYLKGQYKKLTGSLPQREEKK